MAGVCVCVCVRAAILEDEREEHRQGADGDGQVPPATGRKEDHREGGMQRTKEQHALRGACRGASVLGRAEVHQCRSAGVCRGGGYGGGAGSAAEAETADLQPPLGGSLGHSLHCGQVGRVVLL